MVVGVVRLSCFAIDAVSVREGTELKFPSY